MAKATNIVFKAVYSIQNVVATNEAMARESVKDISTLSKAKKKGFPNLGSLFV